MTIAPAYSTFPLLSLRWAEAWASHTGREFCLEDDETFELLTVPFPEQCPERSVAAFAISPEPDGGVSMCASVPNAWGHLVMDREFSFPSLRAALLTIQPLGADALAEVDRRAVKAVDWEPRKDVG